jgi:hypothetical protein
MADCGVMERAETGERSLADLGVYVRSQGFVVVT